MITEQDVKSKTIERFWSKIKFDIPYDCWEWVGTLSKHDDERFRYGWFGIKREGKHITVKSHRIMYEYIFGVFDRKLDVLHRCDNPKCVNPNHLWVGTHQDNMDDMIEKGRSRFNKNRPNGRDCWKAKLSEDDVRLIRDRLDNKVSLSKIATEFSISLTHVKRINSGKCWKHIISGKMRSGSNMKLSEDNVKSIKLRLQKGDSQYLLARDFGVTQSTINSIHLKKSWVHI